MPEIIFRRKFLSFPAKRPEYSILTWSRFFESNYQKKKSNRGNKALIKSIFFMNSQISKSQSRWKSFIDAFAMSSELADSNTKILVPLLVFGGICYMLYSILSGLNPKSKYPVFYFIYAAIIVLICLLHRVFKDYVFPVAMSALIVFQLVNGEQISQGLQEEEDHKGIYISGMGGGVVQAFIIIAFPRLSHAIAYEISSILLIMLFFRDARLEAILLKFLDDFFIVFAKFLLMYNLRKLEKQIHTKNSSLS